MLLINQEERELGREQQLVRKVQTFHIVIKTFEDVGKDFQLLTALSTVVDKAVNKMVQFNLLVLLQKRRFELNWLQVDMVLFIRMSLYSSKISSNHVSLALLQVGLLTSSVRSTTSKQCFDQPAASFLVCSLISIEYYSLFTRLTQFSIGQFRGSKVNSLSWIS